MSACLNGLKPTKIRLYSLAMRALTENDGQRSQYFAIFLSLRHLVSDGICLQADNSLIAG